METPRFPKWLKLLQNHYFGSAKPRCENIIKHIVHENRWVQFPETVKRDAKIITFLIIPCWIFALLWIITFPIRGMHFEGVHKPKRQILMNIIAYEESWIHFPLKYKDLMLKTVGIGYSFLPSPKKVRGINVHK